MCATRGNSSTIAGWPGCKLRRIGRWYCFGGPGLCLQWSLTGRQPRSRRCTVLSPVDAHPLAHPAIGRTPRRVQMTAFPIPRPASILGPGGRTMPQTSPACVSCQSAGPNSSRLGLPSTVAIENRLTVRGALLAISAWLILARVTVGADPDSIISGIAMSPAADPGAKKPMLAPPRSA